MEDYEVTQTKLSEKARNEKNGGTLKQAVFNYLKERTIRDNPLISIIRLDDGKTYIVDKKTNKVYCKNPKTGTIKNVKIFLKNKKNKKSYYMITIDDITLYWHQFVCFLFLTEEEWKEYLYNPDYEINHMVILANGNKGIIGIEGECLEIVLSDDNKKQRRFVRDYNLFGVRVSVKDIDKLKTLFRTKGITKANSSNAADEAVKLLKQLYPDIQHDYR